MKPVFVFCVLAVCVTGLSDAEAGRGEREPRLRDLQSREAAIRRDMAVHADTEKAARSYRDFLALDNTDPGMRADALRRVGDLSLARSEALSATDEAATGAGRDAAQAAVDAYLELLDEQPQYADADAVLYQLARAYQGAGQPEVATATLDRLVTQFPGSTHYAEAQFRRGETFFSEQRYVQAEAAYSAVVNHRAPGDFYKAALYKQGWAQFKQSNDQASTQSFLRLLDTILVEGGALLDREQLGRADRELVDDASRAMSINFAAADGAGSLQAALRTHGPALYEAQLYASLGDLYVEKERFQDAAETYRAFGRRQPMDPQAPLLLVRATEAYAQGGFDSLVLDGKRELVESYGPRSEFWLAQADALDARVNSSVQSSLLDLARHHHAAAQANESRNDLGLAVRWYREYLDGFDDTPQAPATRLLLADLLFDDEQYLQAADQYERAAYTYRDFATAGRAGYAALVCYEKAMPGLAQAQRAEVQQRAVDSAVRFADTFPAHQEVPGVLTRATRVVFENGDRERAEALAQRVLGMGPRVDADGQRVAWTVLAHTYFDSGRYVDSERAFAELAERLPADDPERSEVIERLAASVYRQAEARQAAGDRMAAVDEYLRVAIVAPSSGIRATAEYDAATLLVQMQQWDRAVVVLQAFRRQHPQSDLQPEVTRKLAAAFLASGRSSEAAIEFERLASTGDATPDMQRVSLWQAAELHAQAGDGAAAARVYATYVERFPQPFEPALEARQELADLAGDAGRAQERARWLEAIIIADAGAGAARSERSRYLAARASLELAQPPAAVARSIRLTAPLDRSLLSRKQAMETALEGLSRTIDFGLAEFTTQANYQMADLYTEMGRALIDSERPTNLSAEELEQYDILLEEQAFPFEEKAIEIHESNARLAAEGIYDDSVKASFAELARMMPGRYAREESSRVPAEWLAASPDLEQQYATARASVQGGQFESAARQLESALTVDPANAPAWNELGICYRRLGQFGQARAAYEKAIAADPVLPDPQRNLGILLDLYLGDPVQALQHYERYERLAGESAAEVNRWLAELRRRVDTAPRTAEVQP